jgi:hypothetical protein
VTIGHQAACGGCARRQNVQRWNRSTPANEGALPVSVRHAEQTVIIDEGTDDAFALAQRVLDEIGTVSHVDLEGRFLQGTTRSGFQRVRVGITARPTSRGTALVVEASSHGTRSQARKGVSRVVGALGVV